MGKVKEFIKSNCPNFTSFIQLEKQRFRVNTSRKEYKSIIDETRQHYKKIEDKLRNRSGKLRIGAYVPYDTSFSAYSLFDLLISNSDLYEVKLVIIPVTCRGREHLVSAYHKTKESLSNRFGIDYIMDGWNEEDDTFIDCSSYFDIVYLSNPYDSMVNEIHGVEYLSKKDILPFHINYGFTADSYSSFYIFPSLAFSLFWKVFIENNMTAKDMKKYQLCKADNVIVTGYSKMDGLSHFKKENYEKKRVLICPHHTVNYSKLSLSNFLSFYDLIPELPSHFPGIEFIFRPHPLLFTNLVNEKMWSQEKVSEYLDKIKEAGIVYSFEGDYMKLFVNSDGMIHDCNSFIGEYLYTKNPCCYIIKNDYSKNLSGLGKKCMKMYYHADSREKIFSFLNNVIMHENDPLKTKREKFYKTLAINYPHVSEMILREITIKNGENSAN